MYAFIIGLSFMFVKITLTVASPLDTLAHRFTIALIGATLLMKFHNVNLTFNLRDLFQILPLAIFYPLLFFSLQVFGLVHTSSSEAGVIQATVPIFTLVLAGVFLKERSTPIQLIFISLSVSGVIYLLFMKGVEAEITNLIGSGFILLSAIASSMYQVFARKLTQRFSLLKLTYIMTLIGFLMFNGMAVSNHMLNGTTKQFFHPFMHLEFILSIAYLGILSSLVTSYLSNYVLSKIEASKMSVFSNLATLITIIAGVIFLQEELHFYHIIGSIVIIIGVVGTNYFGKPTKKSNNKLSSVRRSANQQVS